MLRNATLQNNGKFQMKTQASQRQLGGRGTRRKLGTTTATFTQRGQNQMKNHEEGIEEVTAVI